MKKLFFVYALIALAALFAAPVFAAYAGSGASGSDAAVSSASSATATPATPARVSGGALTAQAAVVSVESGKQIVAVADEATTLVSAKTSQPIQVNGQAIAVAPATVSASSGGQVVQATQVVELSVAAIAPGELMPPLPPTEATILPAATSAPPLQAIPIEQPRAIPPLQVGQLGPWHSMWMEGCVASMPAPLNRVTYVYRQVRKCADGSFLDEKANQLMILNGGYCNFYCQNRFYEQCIADGSFDAYYVEQCPEITLPTPGLAPNDVPLPPVTAAAAPIAVDANSRVYNSGCQASLPEPFDKVLRVEREVRSCADDSLTQKQTILTKGDYCSFDRVDLKAETCAADAAGANGVYVKETCFTSEAGASGEAVVSNEEAQQARVILKKIRVERLAASTTAGAVSSAPALKISSEDAEATTQLDILVKNQRLLVKNADSSEAQAQPVALLPDAVKASVASSPGFAPESVSSMQIKIDAASGKAVYEVNAAKNAKLLGFIPVKMPTAITVSAEDASVVSESKPWWSAFASG